jgi:hypothetical protein
MPQRGANPTLGRRLRVIGRLEEQKRLVTDPNYKRTIRTSVKKDGVKTIFETQNRVMPWWRVTGNGDICVLRSRQGLQDLPGLHPTVPCRYDSGTNLDR